MTDTARQFVVSSEDTGKRLDVFLAAKLADWSRSQVHGLIERGLVMVGSRLAKKAGEKLEPGTIITAQLDRAELKATAEDIPLTIVYEDDDLLVVDKPAGMVVHVGAGVKSGTLVNALLHHVGKLSGAGGDLRPGIVHRLDKMTSGLMIVAKNDSTHRALAAQFKSREVHKTYLALVHGRVAKESGEISQSVGRDPSKRVRMRAGGLAPREAQTRYRIVRRFPHFTLLEAMPLTGRTHQIRVHMAHIGHPVVGDTLYGAPGKLRLGGRDVATLDRTFLHAARLEFVRPRSGEVAVVNSPLPTALEGFLARLEKDDR